MTTPTADTMPSFPECRALYDTLSSRICELEKMLAQSPYFMSCKLPLYHVLSVNLELHGDRESARLRFKKVADTEEQWQPLTSAPLHIRVEVLLYAEAIAKCMREEHAKRIGNVQKAITEFDALRPSLTALLQEPAS